MKNSEKFITLIVSSINEYINANDSQCILGTNPEKQYTEFSSWLLQFEDDFFIRTHRQKGK